VLASAELFVQCIKQLLQSIFTHFGKFCKTDVVISEPVQDVDLILSGHVSVINKTVICSVSVTDCLVSF